MGNRNIGAFDLAYKNGGVEFRRVSMSSGKSNSMMVDLSMMQFTLGLQKWLRREGLIQDIFPTLDADTREFIQSGITPSEWAEMFAPDEDADTELNNPEVA
jgi:hypothetical protein